jgi:hypothetical protein
MLLSLASLFFLLQACNYADSHVRLSYNSYFSTYFLAETVFFSHDKSTNSTFNLDFSAKRTDYYSQYAQRWILSVTHTAWSHGLKKRWIAKA